jgi:putative ABC transport system substrate-binding protein
MQAEILNRERGVDMRKIARYRKKILYTGIALFFAAMSFAGASFAQENKEVVILLSDDIQPYRDAVEGFKDRAKEAPYAVKYDGFVLNPDDGENRALAEKIASLKPDLVFTVGTQASLFVKGKFKGVPIVFSMVLNPVENGVVSSMSRPGNGMTGVCLNVSVDNQFAVLKQIKPAIRRVGMLYNVKAVKAEVLDEIAKTARAANVELVAEPVFSEKDVSAALDKVLSKADSLWASPDPMIYNSSTAQRIILSTIKTNTPFMAYSKNFVKAGALAALECDYRDIGKQAGEMAVRVIGRKSAEDFGVEYPRQTVIVINKRTADTIGLSISKELLDKASIYGN